MVNRGGAGILFDLAAESYDPLGSPPNITVYLRPITIARGPSRAVIMILYDGLWRMRFAHDSVGSTNAEVTMVYDSLSRVVEESESY